MLAPYLSLVPAFLTFAVVPIGGDFDGGDDGTVSCSATRPTCRWPTRRSASCWSWPCRPIAVYGVMLAGWSSGSKYPLLGSVRASAQMVSYEAALGLSVVAVVLVAGSLRPTTSWSARPAPGLSATSIPDWNLIATGFVPFVVFLIAGTAELNRPPFDLVEAEQELVGGFHTEYSSIRFALFFLAEFMNTVTMSAIIVTLFLGGPAGPVLFGPDWMWGLIWFFAQAVRLPVHVRVVPGHAAPLPLRPADGPGLEGPDPAGARLAAAARRHQGRPRRGLEHGRRGRRVVVVLVVAAARLLLLRSAPPAPARRAADDEEVLD